MIGFIDEATVRVSAGSGGHGCVSFRREKFIEFGGPDGGNGGFGGNVVVSVAPNRNTLLHLRYTPHVRSSSGVCGSGNRKNGAKGKDANIYVPLGTKIKIMEDNDNFFGGACLREIDFDLPNVSHIVAHGGKGGVGNYCFKTSTNRAPRRFTKGEVGESFVLLCSLKLMADVGLIGFPNAGKSTFISKCSSARPKVADYAFTTLKPHLGVVECGNSEFVMVDIPGLIKNASNGRGLGCRFLKHIERCNILLHLIDSTVDDVAGSYQIIKNEMCNFNCDLSKKVEIVLLTKSDLISHEDLQNKILQIKSVTASSVYSTGVNEDVKGLLFDLHDLVYKISGPSYQKAKFDPLLY